MITRLKRLRNSCIQLPITINVSERDFSIDGFADVLEERMLKAKLPTSLLGIECPETERIVESPSAMRGLEMLKLRGFGISLDDFGTGYSNISYLRRMPLDVIKLDRSLISELSSDTASRIIARNIIAMLKELDYVVLAEGVECVDTVEALTEYGCDRAQGFSTPGRWQTVNWITGCTGNCVRCADTRRAGLSGRIARDRAFVAYHHPVTAIPFGRIQRFVSPS